MLPPRPLDETLKPFATDTQWEYYLKYCELGSLRKVAKVLGRSIGTIAPTMDKMLEEATRQGWEAPQPEMISKGVSTLYDAAGNVKATWDKTKLRGMDPDDPRVTILPDPKKLVSVSTMTDQEGRVIVQWSKEKAELAEREALWEQFAETILSRIPSRAAVEPPKGFSHSDLLACYPIGDQHHGLAAWAHESGKDWDLKISDTKIRSATHSLIGQCPPCDQAILCWLGDYFHYDSYKPVTPQHKNLLDADSRMPKMVDTGWLIVEHMIQAALERHKNVHVVWEAGNHDEALAPITRGMLRRLYRDNPRVTIDSSDAFWHYYEFGKVMLWTNHGDRVKPSAQESIAASDQPKMWGRTTYRMGMLGHRHHEERKAGRGAVIETFAVLPPEDAHAHRGGYRSMQQMHALVFHKAGRLQSRHMFYPDQVEAS